MTIYCKVGTTLRDSFFYISKVTFAGVTGKTQGSFTIQVSKNATGNQSTTGIVITEVDATNNPGEYDFTVNAVTGFAATTGEWSIKIYDTADPQYMWTETYIVTSDGTGAGTAGISFTSSTSDGRVTAAGSALAGATVYLRTPSGVLFTSTTTNALGNWGPVYLDGAQAGTWTATATKSGYSQASSSLTVTSTTVTGPGADIAISAVTTGSGTTLSELMAYARKQVLDRVGVKADDLLKTAINDALVMLSREREWPYYRRFAQFRLYPNYSTGTITLTQDSAVVTLSGGTFPATATSLWSLELAGQFFPIATRDSGTQVTMAAVWGSASTTFATSAWNIFQDAYTLPTDCQKFGRIYPGESWVWGGVPTSYADVNRAKNMILMGQKFPSCWGIHKNRIVMWPYPQTATSLGYDYYVQPERMVNSIDEADIDSNLLEPFHRAIDYHLAIQFGQTVSGSAKDCRDKYEYAMQTAMGVDKQPAQMDKLLFGDTPSWPVQPRIVG